jgi:hypothetical protein
MKIVVKYEDRGHGVVRADELQELIQAKGIVAFRRLDEEWVKIGIDEVRGDGGIYKGPERRDNVLFGEMRGSLLIC